MKKDYIPYLAGSIIAIAFALGFVFGQQILKRDVWTGFYYPDKEKIEDMRTWIVSPPLYSLDECRRWVNTVHKSGDNYDYQCGQGCRFTTKYRDTTICKTDTK